MSGKRIDDHSSWVGGSGNVFPAGAKMKEVPSVEGAGAVMRYEDTESEIASAQKAGVSKIKGRPMQGTNRN